MCQPIDEQGVDQTDSVHFQDKLKPRNLARVHSRNHENFSNKPCKHRKNKNFNLTFHCTLISSSIVDVYSISDELQYLNLNPGAHRVR